MRLIDADACKRSVKAQCDIIRYYSKGLMKEIADLIETAVEEELNMTPTIEIPQWIPCSERLPVDDREVIMQLTWGIEIGWRLNGIWKSEYINKYDDDDVIAWMPLPEPFKE